jgi:hypothetical protein
VCPLHTRVFTRNFPKLANTDFGRSMTKPSKTRGRRNLDPAVNAVYKPLTRSDDLGSGHQPSGDANALKRP